MTKAVWAVALCVSLGAGFLLLTAHGAKRVELRGTIEPEAAVAFSVMGGRVSHVLAQRGELVTAGEVLVQFENADLDRRIQRAHTALRQLPGEVVDTALSLLERMPATTWSQLVQTDPELMASEQEYVDALRELER